MVCFIDRTAEIGLRARVLLGMNSATPPTAFSFPNQLPQSSRWPTVLGLAGLSFEIAVFGAERKSRWLMETLLPVAMEVTVPPLSPLAP